MAAGPVAQTVEGERWALVVGVDDPSAPAPGRAAEGDADAVHRLLVDRLGFEEGRAQLLTGSDATPSRVRQAIGRLAATAPGDDVVIYIAAPAATHDLPDGSRRGVLLRGGAGGDGQGGLSVQTLSLLLRQVPARRVLVVVDAALGGTNTTALSAADATGAGRHLLVAAGAGESVTAREGSGAPGRSALVQLLLRALGEGAADADGDGRVRSAELGVYVLARLPGATGDRQHPYFRGIGTEGAGVTFAIPAGVPAAEPPLQTAARAGRGSLRVVTTPPGALVRLDGRVLGQTPLAQEVPAGEGLLSAEREGYQPYEWSVHVEEGGTVDAVASLTAAGGTLAWRGLPDGASVSVDGAAVTAGEASLPVPIGRREVEVRLRDGTTLARSVRVGPAAETVVEYRPRGFRARYLVSSIPIPGLGQVLDGAPLEGAAVVGGLLGALALERVTRRTYDRERAAYDESRARYLGATTEADATRLRVEMEAQYEAALRARSRITQSHVAFAGVYVLNLLDAYLHHTHGPVLAVHRERVAVSVAPAVLPAGGPGVALSLRF